MEESDWEFIDSLTPSQLDSIQRFVEWTLAEMLEDARRPHPDDAALRRTVGDHAYLIFNPHDGTYKIGYSNDVRRRLSQIASMMGVDRRDLRFIDAEPAAFGVSAGTLESRWHQRFADKRIRQTEWFRLTDEEVAEFRAQAQKTRATLSGGVARIEADRG